MSFRPGPCCRAWTSGTLTWLRAWGKTPTVFPGIPVELLWRYVASWKMWYLETHEKECSCQLSWCHLGQWCNWTSISICCISQEGCAGWVTQLSPLMVWTDFFPFANKEVCHLKTNPSWLYCWRYLWWQEGVLWACPQLLWAMSAGFALTDWMALLELSQGALTQILPLAGGVGAVSSRRQAVKSSRVGGNGWYF